jgi:hypothetical protein
MLTEQLYYDAVCNLVHDAQGKTYPIKEHSRRVYVNYNDKQISVTKLPTKKLIRDFDDFIFWYVFTDLHVTHPCLAMEYFIHRKMTKDTNITTNQYLEFKKNKK